MALVGSSNDSKFDVSGRMVTILSLFFTLISIGVSVSEYILSRHLLKSNAFVMISFEAKCEDFQNMNKTKFKKNIIFKKNKFLNNIARILRMDKHQIERLKPIITTTGVIFTLFIQTTKLLTLKPILESKVADKSIAQVKFLFCI